MFQTRFGIIHTKTTNSNSGDVAPSLLHHHHAHPHLMLKQLQSVQIQNGIASHRSSCCRDRSHIRPSTTSKLPFVFEPDSSQIVSRQHRTKRQLQIRYVYRYRGHAFSLYLHWFTNVPSTLRNVERAHHPIHINMLM